jgi:hypothetical protein
MIQNPWYMTMLGRTMSVDLSPWKKLESTGNDCEAGVLHLVRNLLTFSSHSS